MITLDKYLPLSVDERNKILTSEVKDGICYIVLDMKDYPTNVMNANLTKAIRDAIKQYETDAAVKGFIITSAKKEFIAGADLKEMSKLLGSTSTEGGKENLVKQFYESLFLLREIEKVTKPKVSILEGTTLGGGFEVTLATNCRIAINNPKIQIGFPEIQLGLFPGAGGSTKFPYIVGIQAAIEFILKASKVSPEDALKKGLIHAVANDKEEAIKKAIEYIHATPNAVMPWDDKGYRIPNGALIPKNVPILVGSSGNALKMTHGNMPNVKNFLSVIGHGMQLPMDRAIEVEARFFTDTVTSKEAKSMIRTLFINSQNATKGKYKPAGLDGSKKEFKKVGVLGAGMMGAGITYATVSAGLDVVLKDVSIENAEKGKDYTRNLLQAKVSKGRMTQEKMNEMLAKITATSSLDDLKGCDLIVEAVFETIKLKADVTKETEAQLEPTAYFASNTSSIPITKLAESSVRPENFIGIHFFSPVDKMMLVEIIPGEKTSKETIAAAVDYVAKIKKIPIIVKDSYSFYVNRLFGVLFQELGKLVNEGVSIILIENLWKKAGMPVGPFALVDELNLSLVQKLSQTAIDLGIVNTEDAEAMKWANLVGKMIEAGRMGKKEGKGFYDYSTSPKKMWTGLKDLFPEKDHGMEYDTITKRLFHRAAVETARCLDEGIVNTPDECDLGSVFGMGFLPHTGGTAGYMDFIGLQKFIAECDELAAKYGNGFKMPESFRSKKSVY
jgi:3-hydroxyacyl-CoA dehydrogenase / enoyl-CoA hydratase / 3-hydroxybutyryl-CoA epimerase